MCVQRLTEFRIDLIKLERDLETKLYKMLSEKYEQYKTLDPKVQKIHPFRDILIDLFERYNDVEDLFEEIFPVIAVFQQNTEKAWTIARSLTPSGSHYDDISKIYPALTGRSATQLFEESYETGCTRDQIVEFLKFYSQFKNLFVLIEGGGHVVGLYITANGKIKYFDPNFPNKGWFSKSGDKNTFQSVEDLADHMIKCKYNYLGKIGPRKPIVFQGVKFANTRQISMQPVQFPEPSPNGWKKIDHAIMKYALLRNDESRKQLLEACYENPSDLYVHDRNDLSPIKKIAKLNEQGLMDEVNLFLAKIKTQHSTPQSPQSSLQRNHPVISESSNLAQYSSIREHTPLGKILSKVALLKQLAANPELSNVEKINETILEIGQLQRKQGLTLETMTVSGRTLIEEIVFILEDKPPIKQLLEEMTIRGPRP